MDPSLAQDVAHARWEVANSIVVEAADAWVACFRIVATGWVDAMVHCQTLATRMCVTFGQFFSGLT